LETIEERLLHDTLLLRHLLYLFYYLKNKKMFFIPCSFFWVLK